MNVFEVNIAAYNEQLIQVRALMSVIEMRIVFTSILLIMLSACGSDISDDYYPYESTINPVNQQCSIQANEAANDCYDTYCSSCGGFGCLYCWSSCSYSSQSTYYSCCISSGCTQSISGFVKDSSGAGVADVQLSIDNMLTQYTDNHGYYSFADTDGGTLIPFKQGLCFSPESRTYSQDYKRHTSENFTAKTTCYSISGKITLSDSTAVEGVTVELSGTSTATTSTNSSGYYYFYNLTSGTYTVTPIQDSITPLSRSVTIETSNATDQNFII